MTAGSIPSLMLAALSATTVLGASAALARPDDHPLIPREVFFGNPDRASVQISPDGKTISFLAAKDGVLNIWTAPAGDPGSAKPVTSDTKRGIRQYNWAFSSTHILYRQDLGGDENWKIFAVDLATNTVKDLTPFETIPGPDGQPAKGPDGKVLRPAALIEGVSEKFPDEVVIGLNTRNPQLHDLFRVNIKTGDMKMIAKNEQFAGYSVDDDFKVRLGMAMTADGGSQIYTLDDKLDPKPFQTVGMEDALTTNPVGFDKSGTKIYMTDSRGRDTAALTLTDPLTGKATVVAEDSLADVGGVMSHPTEKTIQAVSFNYDRTKWKVLDKTIQPDMDYLKTVADGEFNVGSRTMDDSTWVVSYLMDNGPVRYYLYDRKAKSAKFLFTNRKSLDGLKLAKMHPVVIKARDGLNLVSYLTVPPQFCKGDDYRKMDKAVPMVLLVHGGPWARDNWGFNPYHQWLSNRGYAVLSVNFRGSTGLGKKFVNAGNLEWAAKMHDDLLDAVNWAVSEKIADKSKVAIMGGSYGGYATLVGLTFTPETFACGVDIVGPSNIITLLKTIPPYWQPMVEQFAKRVGDHRTEDGRKLLESRSPLTFVERITKPLLIGQGANDPRVKQSEADQIVAAMEKKHIPVTYVLFPDEGHGFARPENNMAFNSVTEAFLASHLGGRAEPIGEALSKSTAQVKSGAEHVTGLNTSK